MPEIRLDRTGVVAIVGELLAASMAQHMGMSFDAQIGRDNKISHEALLCWLG
jgi:hypothetical protein